MADNVFQYVGAATRTSGSQNAAASFALAAGDTNPQDIADPPPVETTGTAESTLELRIPQLDSPLALAALGTTFEFNGADYGSADVDGGQINHAFGKPKTSSRLH